MSLHISLHVSLACWIQFFFRYRENKIKVKLFDGQWRSFVYLLNILQILLLSKPCLSSCTKGKYRKIGPRVATKLRATLARTTERGTLLLAGRNVSSYDIVKYWYMTARTSNPIPSQQKMRHLLFDCNIHHRQALPHAHAHAHHHTYTPIHSFRTSLALPPKLCLGARALPAQQGCVWYCGFQIPYCMLQYKILWETKIAHFKNRTKNGIMHTLFHLFVMLILNIVPHHFFCLCCVGACKSRCFKERSSPQPNKKKKYQENKKWTINPAESSQNQGDGYGNIIYSNPDETSK